MHESHQGRIAAETTPEDKGRTTGAAATTSRAATANNRPYGNGLRVADNGYIVTGYLFLIYPNALRRTITNTNQKIEHQVGLGICRVTLWSEDPAWNRSRIFR